MTPITSSNLRSSSPHRDRTRCALTSLPCAAVNYPTVLRFDVAIGQRPSTRFECECGQASHQSGAATVTSEVTLPTQRRSRKCVHQESSNHGTRSGDALIARGSGFCRAHLIATSSHRNTIASLRHRPLSTSAAVGIPKVSLLRSTVPGEVHCLTVTSEVTCLTLPRPVGARPSSHLPHPSHPSTRSSPRLLRRRWSYPF
jgi:hypothetical protein